jgi:hypothetical protein
MGLLTVPIHSAAGPATGHLHILPMGMRPLTEVPPELGIFHITGYRRKSWPQWSYHVDNL